MTLRQPIKDGLERKLDDARLAAVWRRVRQARQGRSSMRAWRLALVALPLAAVALVFWLRVPRTVAPLKLADASSPAAPDSIATMATDEAPRTVDFDDGSRITLSPGGLLQTVANQGRVFGTKLVRGRAEFRVRPGGPRRWIVQAGRVTVEVVGTHFVVDRGPRAVSVAVHRGEVLVRGAAVAGGAKSLHVGESLAVPDVPEPATLAAPGQAPPPSADGVTPPDSTAPADSTAPPPAAYQIATERIAGADPHLPDAVKRRLRGKAEQSFSARICVGTDGNVADVTVLQGIAGADESLTATLRAWRYATQPIPVCFVTQLVFSVE